MTTPRDLMSTSWHRYKELVLLKGNLEDYVLFTIAKLGSLAVGIGIGYCFWGA
jgi:hypothetical protein